MKNMTQEMNTRSLFRLRGSGRYFLGEGSCRIRPRQFPAENMRLSHYLFSSWANVYVFSNKTLRLFTLCLTSIFIRRKLLMNSVGSKYHIIALLRPDHHVSRTYFRYYGSTTLQIACSSPFPSTTLPLSLAQSAISTSNLARYE